MNNSDHMKYNNTSKISKLSHSMISKIAAGEVIERPVSVVKELVENALDANSNKIIIELEDGGKNLIRVIDNGDGIDQSDLMISVENHTTSKHTDLNNIHTYGFRGEALSAINSIAELSIVSKKIESNYGYKLSNNIIEKNCQITAKGTIIEVLNLFWKTPARLKFLQSNSSELSRIVKYIKNVAMIDISVSFVLFHNKKKLHEFNIVESLQDRVFNVLQEDIKDYYHIHHQNHEGYKLQGFISKNHISYRSTDNIYFFVNNRIVKNRKLINNLIRSYRDVMMVARYPGAVIFLTLPLEEVDVNVHPAKTEVRFSDDKIIEKLIEKVVKEKVIFIGIKEDDKSQFTSFQNTQNDNHSSNIDNNQTSISNSKEMNIDHERVYCKVGHAQGNSAAVDSIMKDESMINKIPDIHGNNNDKKKIIYEANNIKQDNLLDNSLFMTQVDIKQNNLLMDSVYSGAEFDNGGQIDKPLGYAVMQIDDLYILSKNHLNECFIIDMHAAHERIIYEGFNREKIKIMYILPTIISIQDLDKINILRQELGMLYNLGFEIKDAGRGQFILYSMPHFLFNLSVEKCIEAIVESLDAVKDLCDEIKRELGCRLAVKKGQKLSIQDMNFLLRDMESTKNIQHCNHGRRVYMKLSHNCLKGLFNRTK